MEVSMQKSTYITLQEVLFYLYFGLLFWAKGIGLYDGQTGFKVVLLLGMAFLAVKLCLSCYSKKDILIILLVIGFTAISYLMSGDKGMFLYGMLVIGMKNVPIRRVFKVGLAVWSISCGALVLYSLCRLYDSPYMVHDKLGLGSIFRWGLGYSHPNVLHISYFILVLLIVYELGKKISWKSLLWLFWGNCIVFLYSISYTGFVMVTFFLAGIFYVNRRKELSLPERILEATVLPACMIISLLLPIVLMPEHSLFQLMDKALNTRLSLAKYFLTKENVSLFGSRLEQITSAQLTMDNAYVFAFIAYGIIFFSILFLGYSGLVYIYGKEQKNTEIMIILSIFVAGLTEPFLFNTSFKNISFLFIGEVLFRHTLSDRPVKFWALNGDKINGFLMQIKRQFNSRRKQILSLGLLAGVLTGGVVGIAAPYPEGYIVPRILCEVTSEEFRYIGEAADSRYQDYLILGNESRDPELLMEYITGNIVTMEKVRGILISGILGAAVTIVLVTMGYFIKNKRKPE